MADRTNIVVVVVVVVVTNCERMTVVEPMGSSVSSLIARHSGMKMPEPSPRDGGIFSLVVASIRVSARVRRACDFSLLVQREVTKRKHVQSRASPRGASRRFCEGMKVPRKLDHTKLEVVRFA